jgi:hypothetical protein
MINPFKTANFTYFLIMNSYYYAIVFIHPFDFTMYFVPRTLINFDPKKCRVFDPSYIFKPLD